MERLSSYKGKEQAFIKHTLLEAYLERLFMIVGQHEKIICYVDCFAGPWQEENADWGELWGRSDRNGEMWLTSII